MITCRRINTKQLKAGYKACYAFRDKIDTDGFDHPRKIYDLTASLMRRGYGDGEISGGARRKFSPLARHHVDRNTEKDRGKFMNTTLKLAILTAFGLAGPLLSQTSAALDAAAQPSDSNELVTIVVTAEKRAEPL